MATSVKTVPGQLYSIPRPPHLITFVTTSPLIAFEHGSPHSSSTATSTNTLIFIGGLTDGLLTIPFTATLATTIPPSWTLVEPIFGSNYRQFGISSLDQDVAETENVVRFFRELRSNGKIVLLGHSTGSQVIIHYLVSESQHRGEPRPKVDGGMMSGSVSDRQGLEMLVPQDDIKRAVTLANEYVTKGRGKDVLPSKVTNDIFPGVPMSANRLLSLTSPGPDHVGQDDYFSSDLPDERLQTTIGRLGVSGARICWLYGEHDQSVPSDIDKHALVDKWHQIARKGGAVVDEESGIVKGVSHTLRDQGPPVDELTRKISGFLSRV